MLMKNISVPGIVDWGELWMIVFFEGEFQETVIGVNI